MLQQILVAGKHKNAITNYLSFENELESSFVKLANHVHQYLFHQKKWR
jgi:hypothetical protein